MNFRYFDNLPGLPDKYPVWSLIHAKSILNFLTVQFYYWNKN